MGAMGNIYRFWFLIASLTWILSTESSAQILIKPRGQGAAPLALRSLSAEVVIDQQIAASRLDLTFRNRIAQRVEADFIYSIQPGTVVSHFAYWYGDERVVARIVEKERAAAIYEHITTRMRDPALIEMIDATTFRARIFPVMPNSDLRVEMTLVQALPGDAEGTRYELPLRMEKGETLESAKIDVLVKPDPGIERVDNNVGVSVLTDADGYHVSIGGANWRPEKDLRIRLIQKPSPLRAVLYAARSGGSDGFFVLSVTPDHTLNDATASIQGVAVYEVIPARLGRVGAYESVQITGRYRGHGAAVLTLKGTAASGSKTYRETVVFPSESVPNNPATKLWAARRIEQLCASGSDRSTVIETSLRYTLPSKFTSWLAVPKAEMERYRQEKVAAEIQVVASKLSREIAAGRGRSESAQKLHAELKRLCESLPYHPSPEDQLQMWLDGDVRRFANDLVSEEHKRGPSRKKLAQLRASLSMLARYTRNATSEILREERANWATNFFESRAPEYLQLVEDGEANSARARSIRNEIRRLRKYVRNDGYNPISYRANERIYVLAQMLVDEQHREEPDRARAAMLRRRLDRISPLATYRLADAMQNAESGWKHRAVEAARNDLFAEQSKDQPDPTQVARLDKQFMDRYRALYGGRLDAQALGYGRTRAQRISVHGEQARVNRQLLARLDSTKRLALLQRQGELQIQENELRARMGDPLIRVDAPADALRVIAIMPTGEIKPLVYDDSSRRWQARFDIPTYAREGEYEVTIVVVLKNGTRQRLTFRFHVDTTAPKGAGSARMVQGSAPTLRLDIETEGDIARVKALLPWGDAIDLHSTERPGSYFGLATVPAEYLHQPLTIHYILTDRAHNRTTVTVDAGPEEKHVGGGAR